MLAERCSYFRTVFAESSTTVVAETPVLSFDFTTGEQIAAFHQLLTFLYTDACALLTAGCRTVHTAVVNGSGKTCSSTSKRKITAKNTAKTCINSAVIDDPVVSLKTMARQFGVTALVKR